MWQSAALCALLLLCLYSPLTSAQRLRFSASGSLSIVQFTDLHLGESPDKDASTLQLVQRVLEAEKPDFVALSGDMISGFAFPAGDLLGRLGRMAARSSWYEQQWRRLAGVLQAAGAPYAAILGNHDGEADLGRKELVAMDIATGGNLSLTRPGPAWLPGAGAYWLDVLAAEGDAVAARIWMLDSGNRGCGRLAYGWGCVPAETVEWVRQQAARLPRVPSLAFVHIPLPQHYLAWNHGPANGSKGELVGCPGVDSGLFELAKEISIQAFYSGHDHNNDFSATLDGVRLAYGRKSGYGSYGPTGGLQVGARVIQLRLSEDPAESQTWIRQADGSQQFQAAAPAAEVRPLRQHQCKLDESFCDQTLGPALCLKLRGARNTAALLASLAGLAAALGAAALAATWLARQVRQRLRQKRGWQKVDEREPHGCVSAGHGTA